MKTKIFKPILFLVTIIILMISCTKTNREETTENPTGAEVFRSQLVTIDFTNTNLTANEYSGTLGSTTVTLIKTDDKKLSFLVPGNSALGLQDLLIPSLKNTTIKYNVKETVLSDTPANTIAPLVTSFSTYSQTLGTSTEDVKVKNAIANFNQIFNSASAEEKAKMAIVYKANKTLFDDIVNNDYKNVTGRMSQTQRDYLAKFRVSTFLFVLGAATTIDGFGFIGIPVMIIAANKSYKYYTLFTNENVQAIGLEIDNVVGTNNKSTNNTSIVLQSEIAKTITFNTKDRKVIESDSNKTPALLVSFFSVYEKYNFIVGKLNTTITWVNKNVPSANFGLITQAVLPTTSQTVNTTVDNSTFGKFTFSINNPNLVMQAATFQSDGKMNLQVKVIGSPATTPIMSTLNYTYNDDFSAFSGSVPIIVTTSSDCKNSTLAVTANATGNSATANANGGQSPYSYVWSNGATTPTINNLTNGTYTVTVTDLIGCTKTSSVNINNVANGTITDIDGNTYNTITIGSQVWTQQNLNVSKYRNGDVIPQVQDPTEWKNLKTGAWCYYNNDTANGTTYGKLYNWYAVNDPRGLAPTSYHVPSVDEWNILVDFLGGWLEAGGKMKATTLWISPNIGATNSSGFTGFGGGDRSDNGMFDGCTNCYGNWWSSSENSTYVFSRSLSFENVYVGTNYNSKSVGYSVRCIKD